MIAFLFSACGKKGNDTVSVVKMPDSVDYNIHIKPILSDRCFACHGPDKNAMKVGLALHTSEGAYAELKENPGHFAIVPGKKEESEVVRRIMSSDPEEMMPPAESNLKLNDYERRLITKWIEQGAVYKPHWSLISPTKPKIPEVGNKAWISNPIDNFILAKLESQGLDPEARATKEKLLRRVTFDITGLPPTIEELDDFLDDKSEDAYEKMVDNLLASISYAERMSSRWLDIARYADSHGYQDDFYRTMWPWREWVIQAYNENKPFDEFIIWQMAGDLLPIATYEQKLASGFNKNHSINQEGGIIEEEYKVEYVADRTNTVGAAVLGLTYECARCHDHKYDPISQKNYYQMYAFFNSVPGEGKGRLMGYSPGSNVTYPEEKLNELRNYLSKINSDQSKAIFSRKKEVFDNRLQDKKFAAWLQNFSSKSIENPWPQISDATYFSFDDLDDSSRTDNWNIANKEQKIKIIRPKSGKYGPGLFSEDGQEYPLGNHDYIAGNHSFTIAFWYYNRHKNSKILLSKIDDKSESGIKIVSRSGYLEFQIQNSTKDSSTPLISDKLIPDNQWAHIAYSFDGSGVTQGISMYVNGETMPLIGDRNQKIPNLSENAIIIVGPDGLRESGIDEIYLADHELNHDETQSVYQYNPIATLTKTSFTELQEADQNRILNHFLYKEDRDFGIALRNLSAVKYKKLDVPDEGEIHAMTMSDLPKPNQTFILNRGAYDAPEEEVFPDTPESILSFSDTLPKNRLGLAYWLVSPKNPLTARVAVNRYWEYIFGRGIVKTLEDFGNQGDLPSHPELLDWLAVTFMENGWNTKAMIKLMVMSSTYQQQSATTKEKREIDPENIYLSRGERYRLPVEMIRDQALAVSGLLNSKIGGPSVRPYQPDNLWGAVTGGGGGPIAKFVLDISEDLYRKSLYTFWKRTVPPPSMLTFDAATRDRCIVSRQNTNTPLQALVLMNDPQYMEAARVMAQNILMKNHTKEENIAFAFRKLTSRNADESEMEMLIEVYEESMASFRENPSLVPELLQVGEYFVDKNLDQQELAAHTIVCSTILNLDETITKE